MSLTPPSEAVQLEALRQLASELPFTTSENLLVERVLGVLASLFPGRALAVRVLDLRKASR